MAKSQMPEPRVKKKKTGRIAVLVIIGIVIGTGSLLFLNRHKIANLVKDIPVLNQVFKQTNKAEDPYGNLTNEQLKEKIVSLEKSLEQATIKIGSLENDKVLLNEKIDALKQYETQYNDFLTQKSNWDADIARTDPELFIKQFETFYPDVAARLYEELKGEAQLNKKQKDFALTISTMDPKKAAEALTTLVKTDPELVKVILEPMKKENRAAILDEMSPNISAQIMKLISPELQ